MQKTFVLFLDHGYWLYCLGSKFDVLTPKERRRDDEDVTITVINHDSLTWGPKLAYEKASPSLCKRIKQITEDGGADIVIIGDNLGGGVSRAQAVADEMKLKTIIVWK